MNRDERLVPTEAEPVRAEGRDDEDVALELTAEGAAERVDLDPDVLPRGLSTCLGGVFLAWNQRGHPEPHANVYVHLVLSTAARR